MVYTCGVEHRYECEYCCKSLPPEVFEVIRAAREWLAVSDISERSRQPYLQTLHKLLAAVRRLDELEGR